MRRAERIRDFQDILRNDGLAGAILYYSRDIFYFTGTAQPSYLVIRPDEYKLFVRRGFEVAQNEVWLNAEQISSEGNLGKIIEQCFPGPAHPGEKIGTELDMLTIPHARALNRALKGPKLVDASPAILRRRMIKDCHELACIRRACTAIHSGHLAAASLLHPGISELELAAAVEDAQRLAGHEGCFFLRTADFVMSRGPLASGADLRHTNGKTPLHP